MNFTRQILIVAVFCFLAGCLEENEEIGVEPDKVTPEASTNAEGDDVDGSKGNVALGKISYDAMCASCHGDDGRDLNIITPSDYSLDSLSEYVNRTMPTTDPQSCEDSCAIDVSAYILNNYDEEAPETPVVPPVPPLVPPSTPVDDSAFLAKSSCEQDLEDFYAQGVDQVVQSSCISCHSESDSAVAKGTRLKFTSIASENRTQFTSLVESEGTSYILNRLIGAIAHGGGKIFEESSGRYSRLSEFLNRYTDESFCEDDAPLEPITFYSNVINASYEQTLAKVSKLIVARMPTESEKQVASDEELKLALRDMLNGDDFNSFIEDGANDLLHTKKHLTTNQTFLRYRHARLLNFPDFINDSLVYRNSQLTNEPLELIKYLVANEMDYRLVLQAPFTVMNKTSADTLGGQNAIEFLQSSSLGFDRNSLVVENIYPQDDSEWLPARFKTGIGTAVKLQCCSEGEILNPDPLPYPHTGVISTFPWLTRWLSTNTNQQRHRVSSLMQQFMDFNFEDLASRPLDADVPASTNPSFTNPDCTSCHKMLDAMAGNFQNWGNFGMWRSNIGAPIDESQVYNREHALPYTYYGKTTKCDPSADEGESGYCANDLWYRDRFTRGYIFEGDNFITPVEGDTAANDDNENDRYALRWLTEQMLNDGDRFARATVKHWLKIITDTEPLKGPEAPPFEQERLTAFLEQQQFIDEVVEVFKQDNGFGAYNLKDVFVEIFMSPWFRSSAVKDVTDESRDAELAAVGFGQLLTPEKMTRKLTAISRPLYHYTLDGNANVTDERIVKDDGLHLRSYSNADYLREAYALLYGGIDSQFILERNRGITSTMVNISKRLALEASCSLVHAEFHYTPEPLAYRTSHVITNGVEPARHKEIRNLLTTVNVPSDNVEPYHTPETEEGTLAIKLALVNMHKALWNDVVDVDSAELLETYTLFVEFWEMEKNNSHVLVCMETDTYSIPDENYIKRAFRDITAYMMMDFKYIYE